MQALSGAVGENGRNARHDVALIQAILVHTARPAAVDPGGSKYLRAGPRTIDGDCGGLTKAAIRQFQYDRVFVGADGRSSRTVTGAEAGVVRPDDATWAKLVQAVPAAFADLRVLAGSKTVYIAAAASQRAANVARVGQLTFETSFRQRVARMLQTVHEKHGIAIGVCPSGDRRTFQHQYELLTSVDASGRPRNVTRAGPGESNHNYGQAVDLGFAGLRWLRGNGVPVTDETSWLHRLDAAQSGSREALIFWEMLRSEGTAAGMFRGPLADRPHLQAWSDAGIDMAERLADLLSRSGAMRWTGRRQRYSCDLGFGGNLYDVGSAAQIWNRQATVTAAMLTQARAQRPGAAVPVPMPGGSGGISAPPAAARRVTQRDLDAMRRALRSEFEAADANWAAWRAR